jgi:hypothetical protein
MASVNPQVPMKVLACRAKEISSVRYDQLASNSTFNIFFRQVKAFEELHFIVVVLAIYPHLIGKIS